MAGRPRIEFNRDAVAQHLRDGFGWKDIATMLGYKYGTFMRWKDTQDFGDVVTKMVPGEELTEAVRQIVAGRPNMGAVAVSGSLARDGISAPRQAVRDALRDVDPEASSKRRKKAIKRRLYDIVVAHELWHQDGWHKLIKFGIVVHGCIDGATRNIIYAEAADNNRAATVFNIFQRTRNRILPHRVRGDKGGENIMLHRFMNAVRYPPPRIGYFSGRSVHNVRIESLWRYMRFQCTQFYMDFFAELTSDHEEAEGGIVFLNCNNHEHLFVLHHMFIPLINESLDLWKGSWNHHKIRTESNRTRTQLLGMREKYPHSEDERRDPNYAFAIDAIATAVLNRASIDDAAAAVITF